MTEHINFEEIETLVYPQKVDPQYFSLAAKVNAHIAVCSQCRQVYEALLSVRQTAERVQLAEYMLARRNADA